MFLCSETLFLFLNDLTSRRECCAHSTWTAVFQFFVLLCFLHFERDSPSLSSFQPFCSEAPQVFPQRYGTTTLLITWKIQTNFTLTASFLFGDEGSKDYIIYEERFGTRTFCETPFYLFSSCNWGLRSAFIRRRPIGCLQFCGFGSKETQVLGIIKV